LGLDGGRTLAFPGQGFGQFGKGRSGSPEGQQAHEQGGVHGVLAEIFPSNRDNPEDQENQANAGGDKCGLGCGAGKGIASQADGQVGQ